MGGVGWMMSQVDRMGHVCVGDGVDWVLCTLRDSGSWGCCWAGVARSCLQREGGGGGRGRGGGGGWIEAAAASLVQRSASTLDKERGAGFGWLKLSRVGWPAFIFWWWRTTASLRPRPSVGVCAEASVWVGLWGGARF